MSPSPKAGEDLEVEGVVEAQLPSALYRVRLSPRDLTRGAIVARLGR